MFRTVAGITVGSEAGKFVNRLAVCVCFLFRRFDGLTYRGILDGRIGDSILNGQCCCISVEGIVVQEV